jgi:molecular chaperone GrpE (heat shock protein)
LIDSHEKDEFIEPTTELYRLKKKHKEIQEVINNLGEETTKLEFEVEMENQEFNQKSWELEKRIKLMVSPLSSLREQLYSEIRGLNLEIDRINEKIQYYNNLKPIKNEIIDIKDNIEETKKKLSDIKTKTKSFIKIIEQFSDNFYKVLLELSFPKLDKNTYINEKLVPYVRNTNYRDIGSLGAIVLITQAWFMAFFDLFKKYKENHPKFFLVDSPQSNIGSNSEIEDYRDENIIKGIYMKYKSLIDEDILEQIIIADSIPPNGYERFYCVKYTGMKDNPPYGLIDDEVR